MQSHRCHLVLGLGCLVLLCEVNAASDIARRQGPGTCIFAYVTAFVTHRSPVFTLQCGNLQKRGQQGSCRA